MKTKARRPVVVVVADILRIPPADHRAADADFSPVPLKGKREGRPVTGPPFSMLVHSGLGDSAWKAYSSGMSANPHTVPFNQPPPLPATDDIARRLAGIQYPLNLSFKIMALASQAAVTDAAGNTVLYTKQKMFKFREHVEIFTDNSMTTRLADIHANKVIDWSARYNSTDASGQPIGSVGRKGWRSMWRTHYEIFNPGDNEQDFSIREENPGAKIMDGLLGGIPIVGLATGYLFHPRYLATRTSGEPMMRLEKKAAFFEGKFEITKLGELSPREELNLILGFMMLVMLERKRG